LEILGFRQRSILKIFFVVLKIVFGAKKIFSDLETIFSKAKTAVGSLETTFTAIETIVITIEAIVFIVETTVFGTRSLFSEAETIFFASEDVFSVTQKIVGEAPTVQKLSEPGRAGVRATNKSSKERCGKEKILNAIYLNRGAHMQCADECTDALDHVFLRCQFQFEGNQRSAPAS